MHFFINEPPGESLDFLARIANATTLPKVPRDIRSASDLFLVPGLIVTVKFRLALRNSAGWVISRSAEIHGPLTQKLHRHAACWFHPTVQLHALVGLAALMLFAGTGFTGPTKTF